MDNHTYFTYQLEFTQDKAKTLYTLKRQVIDSLDHGPTPVSLHTALDFLIFLASYSNPGHVQLSDTFDEVIRRLGLHLQDYHIKVAGPEATWPACCMTCPECHPTDEDEDDSGDGEAEEPAVVDDGSDDEEELFATLEELYGPRPGPAHTGTHRPYPDYEHWDKWSTEEWVRFGGFKSKTIAMASCELRTMGFAINELATIKMNIRALDATRQREIAAWACEIVDSLTSKLHRELFEICRWSTCSKDGGLVQNAMNSDTNGQPENAPD